MICVCFVLRVCFVSCELLCVLYELCVLCVVRFVMFACFVSCVVYC